MFDIVWLKHNKAIEQKAKKLGFDGLFFIVKDCVLIDAKNKNDLNIQIQKAIGKYRFIMVLGSTNEVNRASLENEHVDLLLSPEHTRKKDFMKHRDSGLNHVLCRIASRNEKAIGINFNEFKKIRDKKEKASVLGKIMQNVRLCNKYKVRIVLASFSRNIKDMPSSDELRAFARTLNISYLWEKP